MEIDKSTFIVPYYNYFTHLLSFFLVEIAIIAVLNSIIHAFTDIPKHSDLRPLVQVNECFLQTIRTIGTYTRVFWKTSIPFSLVTGFP